MIKTNNLNVKGITPVIAPTDLLLVYPLSIKAGEFVSISRSQIKEILKGRDRRLMVVVGPCSIHDPRAAMEYAERLAALSSELSDQLFLVMRVY
ncbi:MAG: 3-deoxy-7-phosphoheptulonate synthase, partial [Deltaproteobacteria bacterium]